MTTEEQLRRDNIKLIETNNNLNALNKSLCSVLFGQSKKHLT